MSWSLILFSVFTLACLLNIIYWIYKHFTLKNISVNERATFPPVSVILCSRDHGFELSDKLEKVLTQDYPDYEVVVVDDFSTDESKDILLDLKIKYPHLKPVFLGEMKAEHVNKKDALTTGILFAKNNILLHTDADCEPSSKHWIKHMISGYQNESTQIVLGYGKYQEESGLLNKLIRYDTLTIALQYFFLAKKGLPYMGVGRNLSYTKDIFRHSKGFYKHRKVDSGDDDLFVQSNATPGNTSVVYQPEAFTISTARGTWSGWILQKIRHITSSALYSSKIKLILGILSTLRYLDILCWILLIFTLPLTWLALATGLLVLRFVTQGIVLRYWADSFQEKGLVLLFIIFEILLLFLYPLFIFGKYFTKHQRT